MKLKNCPICKGIGVVRSDITDEYIRKDQDLIALFKTWCRKQGYVKKVDK